MLVRTVPSGALVFLDGKLASSSTPATLTVMSDEFHEIRLEKLGYEPRKVRVTPDDTDSEIEVSLDTETRDIGSLWIDANGAAEVWIDDMYTGYTTPTFGLRVPVGRHTIELRDSTGARSKPAEVVVRRGESMHVTMSLETSP